MSNNGTVFKLGVSCVVVVLVAVFTFIGTVIKANEDDCELHSRDNVKLMRLEDQRIEDKFEKKFDLVMTGQMEIRKDIAVLIDRSGR